MRGQGTVREGAMSWAGPHSVGGPPAPLAGLPAQVSGRFTPTAVCLGGGGTHNG